MNKKTYQQPTMRCIYLEEQPLLAGSETLEVKSNKTLTGESDSNVFNSKAGSSFVDDQSAFGD